MAKRNKILFLPLDGTKPRIVDDEPQERIDRRKADVKADLERRRKERLANRPSKIDWRRIENFIGYGNIKLLSSLSASRRAWPNRRRFARISYGDRRSNGLWMPRRLTRDSPTDQASSRRSRGDSRPGGDGGRDASLQR